MTQKHLAVTLLTTDVKAWASKTLPALRQHLRMAESTT